MLAAVQTDRLSACRAPLAKCSCPCRTERHSDALPTDAMVSRWTRSPDQFTLQDRLPIGGTSYSHRHVHSVWANLSSWTSMTSLWGDSRFSSPCCRLTTFRMPFFIRARQSSQALQWNYTNPTRPPRRGIIWQAVTCVQQTGHLPKREMAGA